jgi:hypothetical protein
MHCFTSSFTRASRRAIACGVLLLAAIRPVWADGPDTSPPNGIQPVAGTTLTDVLSRNLHAQGSPIAGTAKTRRERWRITLGASAGVREYVESGGDYRDDLTLGPTHSANGSDRNVAWRMNANGQVWLGSNLHQADAVDARALGSAAHSNVTLLGETSSPPAYVVEVNPPTGRLEYRFYDKKTYLVARIEEVRDARRVTITLDDYRTTKGVTEPWHIHTTDGFALNDEDRVLETLSIGDPVAASELAIPPSGAPLIALTAAKVSVPARMAADEVVVPVRMGGHTVDFLLDSGAGGIVVDHDVIAALKIKEYGRTMNETAGAYVESDAIVPSMTVGTLDLHNVHVSSLPFVQWTMSGKPIAGLLGSDFIHDVVWHIDYQNASLEAIDPARFVPPPGAQSFSVAFDDEVPTLGATLAGVKAPSLIVDTGADRSTLFSRFVDRYSSQLTDRGLGSEMEAAAPFVDKFSGVGGTVDYRPLQTGPFDVGTWTFPTWLFAVTQDTPSFEFEDYDGLIGQDFLRNFDVYLDYPHQKIYLLPNDRFRARWS